jgi:hypothetical protein
MSRLVIIAPGYNQISLPNGRVYNAGNQVILSDEDFSDIRASAIGTVVIDGGFVAPGGGTTGSLTNAELRATAVPISANSLDTLLSRTSNSVADFAAGRFRNAGGKVVIASGAAGFLQLRNPPTSPVNLIVTEFVLTATQLCEVEFWSDTTLTTPTARSIQMPNRAYEGFVTTNGVVSTAAAATGGTQWSALSRLRENVQVVRAFVVLIPPGKSIAVKASSSVLSSFDLYASATWIEVPV